MTNAYTYTSAYYVLMSEPKQNKKGEKNHGKLVLGPGARIPVNIGHFGELSNQRAQNLAESVQRTDC